MTIGHNQQEQKDYADRYVNLLEDIATAKESLADFKVELKGKAADLGIETKVFYSALNMHHADKVSDKRTKLGLELAVLVSLGLIEPQYANAMD